MRFEFDSEGYVSCILYGCYTGNCMEYSGLVPNEPEEYSDMDDWANRAQTQAYYLNSQGNLTYDAARAESLSPDDEDEGDSTEGSSSVVYTTDEVDTGDKWIDGKPIYRQILQINGTKTNGESLSIPLGNFELGFLIRMDGGFFSGGDFYCFATAHYSSIAANVYTRIRYATVTTPELRIVCGSNRNIGTGYAILEYTKA